MMNDKEIKDFVKEAKLLSEKQLKAIKDLTFKKNLKFFDAAIELGFLDQELLSKISAHLFGIPKVDLKNKIIDIETLSILPELFSRKNNVIAFEKEDNIIKIAFCDLKSLEKIDEFFQDSDFSPNFYLAEKKDIEEKKKKYKELLESELSSKIKNTASKIRKLDDYSLLNRNYDIPQEILSEIIYDHKADVFLYSILERAILNQASFIYFTPGNNILKISLRVSGRNYEVERVDQKIAFSLFSKLRYWADVPILSKKQLEEASFEAPIFGEYKKFHISFVKNDFDEFVTIELLDQEDDFKLTNIFLTKEQQILANKVSEDTKKIHILLGEDQERIKNTFYTYLQKEANKTKNTITLEKNILHQTPFVNQVSVKDNNFSPALLSKILEQHPDTIGLDDLTKTMLLMVFNFVSNGGKAFLDLGKNLDFLLKDVVSLKFDYNLIIRNFGYLVQHQTFSLLSESNRKTYKLNKKEAKIIEKFLNKTEQEELFIKEGMETDSHKNLKAIKFYTKKKVLQKTKNKIYLKGIFDFGIVLGNAVAKKQKVVDIKKELRFNTKKAVLKNALVASKKGYVDIKEVLKYLTKA